MKKQFWIAAAALFLSSCASLDDGFRSSDLEGLEKTGAQQTISSGAGVYWSAEKTKINANFTELYNKVVSSVALSGSDLVITFSDATTISGDISGIQDGTGTDDQTATEVTFTPYSTLASTNVQAAIQELLDEAAGGGASQLTDLSDVSGATSTNRYVLVANGSTFVARLLTEADISDLGTYQAQLAEGAFIDGDKTRLDAIEDGADVTDATNVAAAGAVMDTGNETIAGVKTFSSFPVTPSSAPTTDYQAANKKYVDDNAGAGSPTDAPYYVTTAVAGLSAEVVVPAFIQSILDDIDEATFKATVNLEPGTDYNAFSAYLGNIAGLTPTANNLLCWNAGATAIVNCSTVDLQFTTSIEFEGATADAYEATISVADPVVDVSWVLPYCNFTATAAPGVTNDLDEGYSVGSIWVDVTNDNSYIASDVANGAAVWTQIDSTAGGGDALVANPLSQFAATTSTQLAGVMSDETGSGALVFGTSPTLTTPALGTPSAVTLTNATGLPLSGLTSITLSPIVLAEPDVLQPIADAWPLYHFPAESFPSGVTITSIHISTSATCTDALNFEEWSNNGTAWSTDSTVEAITLSGTHTEDDGTLADASIAADAWLYVDLPATPTDIGYYSITISFTVN